MRSRHPVPVVELHADDPSPPATKTVSHGIISGGGDGAELGGGGENSHVTPAIVALAGLEPV